MHNHINFPPLDPKRAINQHPGNVKKIPSNKKMSTENIVNTDRSIKKHTQYAINI